MNRVVHIDSRAVPIWPEGQGFDTLDGILHSTVFTDTDLYHPGLKRAILEMAQQASGATRYGRSSGGTKLHYFERWGCAEANLIHERALELFRRALKRATAVADAAWVNVYREGDYAMAHSHCRATASLVYFVDPGDPDADDPDAGRFSIVDPRLARCCSVQEGCLSNSLYTSMTPGTLIMFPAAVVHAVNPYRGKRPRITIAWNINETAIEGSPYPHGITPGPP